MIKAQDSTQSLTSWCLDDRVKELVQNTCLYRFASSITYYKLDLGLISYMCQSYNVEDSSFYFGNVRLYLGLQDVIYLTGLPIDGKPVIGNAKNVLDYFDLLDITPIENKGTKCMFFHFHQLETLQHVPEECLDINKYAIAYLMYIIGCIMLPGTPRSQVYAAFVRFLTDISGIDSFGWGAAMLAHTHKGLKRLKKRKESYLSASCLLLQTFAVEHFPKLAEHFFCVDLPHSIPLVEGWTKIFSKKSLDTANKIDFQAATKPNEDGQVMVIWRPYTRLQGLADEMSRQLRLCSSQIYLICLNKHWRYNYMNCLLQLGPLLRNSVMRKKIRKTQKNKSKSLRGPLKDWCSQFKQFIDEWNVVRGLLYLDEHEEPVPQNEHEALGPAGSPSVTATVSPPEHASVTVPVSPHENDPIMDENGPSVTTIVSPPEHASVTAPEAFGPTVSPSMTAPIMPGVHSAAPSVQKVIAQKRKGTDGVSAQVQEGSESVPGAAPKPKRRHMDTTSFNDLPGSSPAAPPPGSSLVDIAVQDADADADNVAFQNLEQHPKKGIEASYICRNVVSHRKKKLLVLDVNGVLADILPGVGKLKLEEDIGKKGVFRRPFYDTFLEFCFDKFNVGVWSAKAKYNVDRVIDHLFKGSKVNLLFIWNQDHCTKAGHVPRNRDKPLFLKELKKLWEANEDILWEKGQYDQTNTLLLDDSPCKALWNPENTGIFPTRYSFKCDDQDLTLREDGELRRYLSGLAEAVNVQEYVGQNRYGQEPITESHPDWNFYKKVLKGDLFH